MRKKQPSYFKSTVLLSLLLSTATITLSAEKLDYDYAIKWAREGEIVKSLEALKMLHIENPHNKNLHYDYIAVLGWAKKDREALELSRSLDFNTVPASTIQNVAKSARNMKKYKHAVKLYVKGAKRFPDISDFYLGLALTLNDMKRVKLSNRVFKKAKEKFPNDLNIKFTQAELYEQNKNFFDAMNIYQDLLSNPKVHDKVVVRLVGTLRRLKMPFAAQKYIDANPKLFDNQTRTSIQADQATFKLRWGTKGYHKEDDTSDVQEALGKIDGVINTLEYENNDPVNNKRLQNAYFDKIIALNALDRKDEVIVLYKELKSFGVNIPFNILNIAGDAYLFNKKSKLAQRTFIESLNKKPNHFKTKILLFHAYSDGYDMNKALALAKSMDKQELPKIWDSNHLHKIENPRKSDTTLLRILAYEYSGYMDQAQYELEALVGKAPLSGEYRSALAKLYFYRGWYDQAQQQYQILINNNPKDFDAKAGKILTALEQRKYKTVHQSLQDLSAQYPKKKIGLKELYKTWEQHNKSAFTIESSYGRDPAESNRDNSNAYHIDAYYYASPINYNWRPFVFTKFSHTEFYKQTLDNQRYGLGAEYKDENLEVNTKLAYNATEIEELAPSIDARFHINDKLSLSGGYAYFSEGTPLRAIMYGTRADSFHAGIRYRASDSRSTSLRYEMMDFTDENRRDTLSLSHFQRLIYGPYYNLDAHVWAGAMQNTKGDKVYYNPEEDAYISVEAKNIWNLYTLYAMNIKQILGLEIGSHWEKEYGSNMTGALSLEQQWQMNENFGFDFGYLRKRSSYDGEIEYASELFLNLNGRF